VLQLVFPRFQLGMNPLMIGAARGNMAMVFMCLRHGARIDAIDKVDSRTKRPVVFSVAIP
jgi:hypothetical protein